MNNIKIKNLWENNKSVLNGWLMLESSLTAEIMSHQGYDSLTIDMQHGLIGYSDLLKILQSIKTSQVSSIVRVPWLDPGIIMKSLDAGANAIICPMINNRNEAEKFISSMRYPPMGMRSFGPTRQNILNSNYYETANSEVSAIAMIETQQAMENLDDIISTPGLDAVYIGPADLTLGLTQGKLKPGMDREEPEMIDAIKRILSTAKKHSVRACLHCVSSSYAIKAINWGFDLVTLNSDVRLLTSSASKSVEEFRKGIN
tara:strand:+ start:2068 stop:2841 length:774 start_codon:yes stop_codon:yes gene_type:complete